MAEKTLGQVAYETYCLADEEHPWQAVADAVVAEHEARRWRPTMERSAEFWRGVRYGYHGSEHLRYADIDAAITEAEARESVERERDELRDRCELYRLAASYNQPDLQAAKRLRERDE